MSEKMKAKIRVATDMYEFIELDYEGDIDEIWQAYRSMKGRAIHKTGLTDKEFNAFLDEYIQTNEVRDGHERYEKMNPVQQNVVQAIKRSIKRVNYKNGHKED